MIDPYVRGVLPRFVQPLLGIYARCGFHPNTLTYVGFASACLAAILIVLGAPYPAIALWWFGRLLDGTDGIWARASEQSSPWGAYLDIVMDMLAYSLMIMAFAVVHPDLSYVWLLILVLYVACITSALVIGSLEREYRRVASADNRGIGLAAGLAEGGETGLAYTAFLLFPTAVPYLAVLWIMVLTTTVVARSLLVKREFSQVRREPPLAP